MRAEGSEGSLISFVPCISLPADPTSLTCCRGATQLQPSDDQSPSIQLGGSSYFWADSASSGGHDMSCTAHCSSGIDRISLAMRDGRGKLPLTPAAAILLGLSMRPVLPYVPQCVFLHRQSCACATVLELQPCSFCEFQSDSCMCETNPS